MVFKIVFGIVAVIAGLLVFAALKPKHMQITRELLIKAPPEVIFPHINSSKLSYAWMPWSEVDPQVKTEFSGPEEGQGSTSKWESPGQMGFGQSVVVESTLNAEVKTQLTYTKPMEMSQLAIVSLHPSPEGTVVRWEVTGENAFIGRLACIFIDMDKVVGGNFEKGLSNLKKIVEATH